MQGATQKRSWYANLSIGLAVGLVVGLLLVVADKASGAEGSGVTTSVTSVQQASAQTLALHKAKTDQNTCDVVESPCAQPTQMHTYYTDSSHQYQHLNPRFYVGDHFKQLATATHHKWCDSHPALCAKNWRWMKSVVDGKTATGGCSSPTWWCYYHWSSENVKAGETVRFRRSV